MRKYKLVGTTDYSCGKKESWTITSHSTQKSFPDGLKTIIQKVELENVYKNIGTYLYGLGTKEAS